MAETQTETKKTAKKQKGFAAHAVLLVAAALLCMAAFFCLAYAWQQKIVLQSLQDDALAARQQVSSRYDIAVENGKIEAQLAQETYTGRAAALGAYLEAWQENAAAQPAADTGEETPTEVPLQKEFSWGALPQAFGVDEVYWLDANGAQLASSGGSCPDLTEAQLAQLDAGESVLLAAQYRRLYGAKCGQHRVLLAVDATDEVEYGGDYLLFDNVLTLQSGNGGSVMVIDTKDNTFTYAPQGLTGDAISAGGLVPGQLYDGYTGWLTLCDTEYYCIASLLEDRYFICSIVERSAVELTVLRYVLGPFGIFALTAFAVMLYGVLLLLSYRKERVDIRYHSLGGVYLNGTTAARLLPIALAGVLLTGIAAFYAQTLLSLSTQSLYAENKLDNLKLSMQVGTYQEGEHRDEYEKNYIGQAQAVAWLVEQNPDCLTTAALQTLAGQLGAVQIDVFDGDGTVQYSSTEYEGYTLGTDENQPGYALRALLQGDETKKLIETDAKTDALTVQTYTCQAAVRRTDGPGLVRLMFSSDAVGRQLWLCSKENIIDTVSLKTGESVFDINAVTKTVEHATLSEFWGLSMQEMTLDDRILDDKYTGYQTINGVDYFLNGVKYEEGYLYVAVMDKFLHGGRAQTTAFELLLSLAACVVLLGFGAVGLGKAPPPLTAPASAKQVTVTMPDGKTRRMGQDEARFYKSVRKWREKTIEDKFRSVMAGVLGLSVLCIAVWVYISENTDSPDPIMSYILGGEWERGINIFAITDCIIVFALVLIVSWLFRRLVSLLLRSAGANAVTAGHMTDGALKYGAIVGAGLYCLNLLGIQTTTLVTSASVATVVLGLGAQSLIGDILAGIFIVLENEFRVGDIVTVDTWRGTVREIGIRTTKIEDAYGNIKIFNNTQISGVINMTKEYSVAECDVSIEYGEDLPRVERVLKDIAFPRMREQLSDIKKGPFYAGVVKLGDSGVLLRVTAQCEESRRIMLEREINREIKLVFDENSVSIPFPQVVVHQAAEKPADEPQPAAEQAEETNAAPLV